MRYIKFLLAPVELDLYDFEIYDFTDSYIGLPIEDLCADFGLKITTVAIDSDNSYYAVKEAKKKLFEKNKGFNFCEISVYW